jgi:hypothetical protein
MGGMPDELYLPSCLRLSSLLLTGWVRKIMQQKSRKIIRRFTAFLCIRIEAFIKMLDSFV